MNSDKEMVKNKREMPVQPDDWNKKICIEATDIQNIDFLNVKNPKNQAKIEIMLIDISRSGYLLFQSDNHIKLRELKRQANDLYNSEYEKFEKQMKVFGDQYFNNRKRKSDTMKKFWDVKWRSDYCPSISKELKEEMEKEFDKEFDRLLSEGEKNGNFEKEIKNIRELAYQVASSYTVPEEPEEYSPPNDPDNKFGWKALRNKQLQLEYLCEKQVEKCHLEEKKSLETSAKIINDDNKTSSSPDEDSAVELNSSSSSDESVTKISPKRLSEIHEIEKSYKTLIKRELIKFLFSEEIISQELRESFKDDMALQYYLNRPTPGLELEVTD